MQIRRPVIQRKASDFLRFRRQHQETANRRDPTARAAVAGHPIARPRTRTGPRKVSPGRP